MGTVDDQGKDFHMYLKWILFKFCVFTSPFCGRVLGVTRRGDLAVWLDQATAACTPGAPCLGVFSPLSMVLLSLTTAPSCSIKPSIS